MEALHELEVSDAQIVYALETVAAGDPNQYVRQAAAKALSAPAHWPFTHVPELPPSPQPAARPVTAPKRHQERDEARRLYLLSLWSPLLILVGSCLGPVVLVLPLVVILLLFVGFRSRYAFARWHTGQWAVLTLPPVMVNSLWFFSDVYISSSVIACLVLTFIGGWYLGNIVGLSQANRGQCWLWRWLDSSAELPRPWALTGQAPAGPPASVPSTPAGAAGLAPTAVYPGPDMLPAMRAGNAPADPEAVLGRGQSLLAQGRRAEAVGCFLTVFRSGPPTLRQTAVEELEKLGEVEMF